MGEFHPSYDPDHIAGPRPGYTAMERTAEDIRQSTRALNETSAARAMSEVKAVLDKALADQRGQIEAEARADRAKLQRELEARHTLVKTIVTVERVSANGLTRRVEHQWEAPNIEAQYRLDQARNGYGSYGYGYLHATITLTMENPTDTLVRAKATHG